MSKRLSDFLMITKESNTQGVNPRTPGNSCGVFLHTDLKNYKMQMALTLTYYRFKDTLATKVLSREIHIFKLYDRQKFSDIEAL